MHDLNVVINVLIGFGKKGNMEQGIAFLGQWNVELTDNDAGAEREDLAKDFAERAADRCQDVVLLYLVAEIF